MFKDLKLQVQNNFKELSKTTLFYVSIDRDLIWEKYLSGFKEEDRQEHNCNCCKSFLRQWGGIVSIIDNKVVSIWDNITIDEEYIQSVTNLRKYIHSLPVTDIFLSELQKCGTDKNFDSKNNTTWEHFYIEVPKNLVNKSNIDSVRGEKRDNKSVLKRSLDELTIDSTETILELISQNSLYRGKEFEAVLKEFLKVQKEYKNIPNNLKDNFAWVKSTQISQGLSRIRNTAIGTLLIDLSQGLDLDNAVTKFERVVAPSNYKRPTSLVTPKMVEAAKAKLEELGLMNSLERRYAVESDLNINDILFTDKSTSVKDVFGELTQDTLVNPKTLNKTEEIGIEDFIKNVLPTSKSIEVLTENSHLNNFTTLITSTEKDSPSLFKWNNNYSWSYTGGITDSIKERVKEAGGKVDGVLRFSIQWNEDGKSIIDLDAHAYEPSRTHIYYGAGYRKDSGNKRTRSGGQLDVDMMSPKTIGVENISWDSLSKLQEGTYRFKVNNYSGHKNFDGFRAEIEFNGEVYEFAYNRPYQGDIEVAEVTYSKTKGFSIKSLIDSKSSINSKEKWGIKTNQWKRVNKFMLSPNHWENNTFKTGNKHYLFLLEGCVSDETPRPFFNEFLKQEFDENRKVFEIMGSKLRVKDSNNQLSGLGFSETQRNHLFVRVDGKFKRILKINF